MKIVRMSSYSEEINTKANINEKNRVKITGFLVLFDLNR